MESENSSGARIEKKYNILIIIIGEENYK